MKRLRKITGPPGSDGLTSSPTVLDITDDDTAEGLALRLADGTPLRSDMVVLVGTRLAELDPETRRQLDIPEHEDAFAMPKDIYLRGARLMESG